MVGTRGVRRIVTARVDPIGTQNEKTGRLKVARLAQLAEQKG